jgi:hypothetical protein
VRNQVRNIRLVSGHQVVQAKYVPALFQHQFAEMGAQKPSAACDYRTQIRFLRRKNFSNKQLLSSKKPSAGTAPSLLILSSHFSRRTAALGRAISARQKTINIKMGDMSEFGTPPDGLQPHRFSNLKPICS